MSRVLQMIIFMTVFLSIYLALNSYITIRLAGLLGFNNRLVLYSIIAFLTLGFPITTLIENIFPNLITRVIYTVSAYWMGMMFFFFCSLLIFEIVNLATKVDYFTAGIVIIFIVCFVSLIATIDAAFVHVKDVVIPVDGLKEDIDIVQLSDLHIGTIRNSLYLQKIVSIVNGLDPDVVVLTGDLVDGTAPLHEDMFKPFEALRADILFVNGNHEMYEGVDKVYALFNNSKIEVLRDEVRDFDGIQFAGVTYAEDKGHLQKVLQRLRIDKKKPAVLLYHSPSELDAASKAGFVLQLSGHTHSGQIVPFNLLTMLVFPKYHGLYDVGRMKLYVSPGTGTWGPYMRLGSKNEITLIRLKA